MFLLVLCATLLSCAVPLETIYSELDGASLEPTECEESPNVNVGEYGYEENPNWTVCCAVTNCTTGDWLNETHGECFLTCEKGDTLLEQLEKERDAALLSEVINAYAKCADEKEFDATVKQLLNAGDRISAFLDTCDCVIPEKVDRAVRKAPPIIRERMTMAWIDAMLRATKPTNEDWSDPEDSGKLFRRATRLAGAYKNVNTPYPILLRELQKIEEVFPRTFPEHKQAQRMVADVLKRLEEEEEAR